MGSKMAALMVKMMVLVRGYQKELTKAPDLEGLMARYWDAVKAACLEQNLADCSMKEPLMEQMTVLLKGYQRVQMKAPN